MTGGAAATPAPAPATAPAPALGLSELVDQLAGQLETAWITAALARRREGLAEIEQQQRGKAGWDAASALRIAHLWLVAGLPGRGDDLVLEADQLLPNRGVVPDWWGLWPAPPAADSAEQAALALAHSYLELRHLQPLRAWQLWLQGVQLDWRSLDQPQQRLLLGLVIHGHRQLPGALEPALQQLVGEEVIQQEPALAWRFFDALSERLPAWSYGRLKAAELSLQRGELARCRQLLEAASEEQWQLAWLHDVNARLTLAEGDVEAALTAWQRAIACGDQAEVVEIFRQRAREARRGPGVLQARSLINRGDTAAAVALLEQLLHQDPQWQPLRSLLEQARTSPTRTSATGSVPSGSSATIASAGPTATATATATAATDLERLEARLRQLAERADLNWPPESVREGGDAAGFERFLHSAMGRLALLG